LRSKNTNFEDAPRAPLIVVDPRVKAAAGRDSTP
jgi:hypothetical protein